MNDQNSVVGVVRYLVIAAQSAPSADNSQPFDFIWNGVDLSICFSRERAGSGLFGALAHATLVAFGAVVECIEQAAEAARLELVWQWLDPAGGVYARVSVHNADTAGLLPVDLPLFCRHTNRFSFSHSRIPAELLLQISCLNERAERVTVVESGEAQGDLVRCVRAAAESRFCNEDLHHWLMSSLRFSEDAISRGDGLDVTTLNLPPGGALFMRIISDWNRMKRLNRLGLYKLLALTETQLLRKSPAILCLVGNNNVRAAIDAGRLLARVWIKLNASGIAVHPYYVVTDQLLRLQTGDLPENMRGRIAGIRDRLPRIVGGGKEEFLHMLLRIGVPTKSVPRSKRLSLDAVFLDKS